jgi:hypothetical protein
LAHLIPASKKLVHGFQIAWVSVVGLPALMNPTRVAVVLVALPLLTT